MMKCIQHQAWSMLIVAVTCGLTVTSAAAIDYSNPPQGVFIDEWLTMEMAGQRVGYLHSEVSRTGDLIHTNVLMSMSLKRMGSPVTITQLQTSKETLDGSPLAFTSLMDASIQKLSITGRIEGGKVHVTSDQFGNKTTSTFTFPTGALMTWGALRTQQQKGFKPGTTYDLLAYEPSMAADQAITMTVSIHGLEKIEMDGKQVDSIKSTQTMKLPNMPTELETTAWLAADGSVLRTSLPMMGVETVMTRTTKAKALLDFSPPEFFMPTTIPARQKIDRASTKRIEFVLRTKSGDEALPPMPTTGMQTPKRLEDGSIRLTVTRSDHAKLAKVTEFADAKKYADYLKANPMINSDDAAVKQMAIKAKGSAKTPYNIADNLRRYVTEVIDEKNLDIGFASASEVCRTKQGDCSEHGVLLAALGRACGIPSRVVVGVVYVPAFVGAENIFGFHMWTQFLIGDQWIDFDAAQNESDCNPTHIAFSVASLQDAGMGQLTFSLMNVIGNLDISIERIEALP